MLVGNKTDLHMERMISSEEGRRLAEDWKAVFLETSAKQNSVSWVFGVERAYTFLFILVSLGYFSHFTHRNREG